VIVRIDRSDEHYPVRINGLELLTPYTYLRVVKDNEGEPVDETWSMLKFWTLVEGRFSARTRQSVFNDALRTAVADAFAAVRQTIVASRQPGEDSDLGSRVEPSGEEGALDAGFEDEDDAASASQSCESSSVPGPMTLSEDTGGKDAEAAILSDQPVTVQATDLDQFGELMTLEQRRVKHHRGKDRHGAKAVSRKRRHKQMRKTNRDSVNVYHAQSPEPARLQRFMRLPAVKVALLRLRKERRRALRVDAASSFSIPFAPAAEPGAEHGLPTAGSIVTDTSEHLPTCADAQLPLVIELDSDDETQAQPVCKRVPIDWPASVTRINEQLNPHNVRFEALGDLGICQCASNGDCRQDKCLNSLMGVYCTRRNCAFGGGCGNAPRELESLRLFNNPEKGTGVFTTGPINADVVVAEYCGVLEAVEGSSDNVPVKHNTGYSLVLPVKAKDGKFVYIEPVTHGSIARFISHSCDSNCEFRPAQYRDKVTVLVVSKRFITADEEITVEYSGELWFQCKCGVPGCVHASDR
jgi:hypothetical protein